MGPKVFEEHSYEENLLENTGVYTACADLELMRWSGTL
jgi:hypothetical protein